MRNERVVEDWIVRFSTTQSFTTAITKAELLYGVALLSVGKRKDQKLALALATLAEFEFRILPFDDDAAEHYARLAAWRKQNGKLIAPADIQIAAIAAVHQGAVVTRNTKDFVDSEIEVINPWLA